MRFALRQITAKALIALCFLWVLNCCTSQSMRVKPTAQEPPTEVKPIPVAAPAATKEAAPVLSTPEPSLYVHIVRWPGESLSHIAQWYTGAGKNWKILVEANPGLNPNRILIGDEIFIPNDLLKTRKPMPRDFLPLSVRKKGTKSSPVEQSPKEPDETALFQPIETEQPQTQSDEMELFGPVENEQPQTESDETELFGPIE